MFWGFRSLRVFLNQTRSFTHLCRAALSALLSPILLSLLCSAVRRLLLRRQDSISGAALLLLLLLHVSHGFCDTWMVETRFQNSEPSFISAPKTLPRRARSLSLSFIIFCFSLVFLFLFCGGEFQIYEGGVLQRGYMTLDSRVIGGYSSNASRARDYSSDGLDVNTNANTMCKVYGKTYYSEEEKRSSFKVSQDNNAFLTQHNQMYRSCTHCPNCLARVAHNQFPSYRDKLPSPPPPKVNCRKGAAEFFRGPKHPVGEMRKKFSKSYEEDCPSATAFYMQHNQVCHSCTHCPNCFAHEAHHQLPSYCCKLQLAPPPEGNSKNSAAKFFMGHRHRVGGRSRKLKTRCTNLLLMQHRGLLIETCIND